MTAMQDPANDRLLSAATIWELAIEVGQRKLVLSMPYGQWMARAIADLRRTILPITRKMVSVLFALDGEQGGADRKYELTPLFSGDSSLGRIDGRDDSR
jgi:PIN domain nuclease of toxin-antitoxin system